MALGPNMPLFVKATAAADAVFVLLDNLAEQGEQNLATGQSQIAISKGEIRLQDLSFAYPSRPDQNALSNVNMVFSSGTSTAVVGPSGAGKSTLISLLERWLSPTSGTILLYDKDISTINVKALRSQIALVQQEPQLFHGSLYENILHGLSGTKYANATFQDKAKLVEDACREARATEFIERLPKVSQYVARIESPLTNSRASELTSAIKDLCCQGDKNSASPLREPLSGNDPSC
jgi:ATP-binding cassette subfamily B (MDR/TAP) protein 1